MFLVVDLKTKIGNIILEGPIYNASGPRCSTKEELEKLGISKSFAILSKSCTLNFREGNCKPRYKSFKRFSINSMGLPNLGYKEYKKILPNLKKFKKPIIASVSGLSLEENLVIIKEFCSVEEIDAIELNLSCPNVPGKPQVGYDFDQVEKVLYEVKKICTKTFGIKLPPYFDFAHFEKISGIINKSGVSFVVCINSLGNGLVIDNEKESVVISPKNGFGGIGGSIIKPFGLSNVKKFRELLRPEISIVGVGGISSGSDMFEYILAGADAVQIGTAFMDEDVGVFDRILNEFIEIMQRKGYTFINQIKNKLNECENMNRKYFRQEEFDKFILENNIIGLFEKPVKLKSERISNYYVNWRNISQDVYLIDKLADFVIQFVDDLGLGVDCFYGVPDGATKLAVIAQYKLAKNSNQYQKGMFQLAFGRKSPKEHGELKDRYFVGAPKGRTIIIEDVTTTGGSLIDAIKQLKEAEVNVVAAVGLTNRMEIRNDGKSVKEAIEDLGVPYYEMSKSTNLLPRMINKINPDKDVLNILKEEFLDHDVEELFIEKSNKIIKLDKSIIPACDVSLEEFENLVKQTCDIEKVGAYKVGFKLGLGYGLSKVVDVARKYTNKPLIYDHQKAGTDIPDTADSFMKVCKDSGIDAIILFPQAGPVTQEAWINSAKEHGLRVIVGGIMTHKGYTVSDGGYLNDEALRSIYLNAARLGVKNFVVPGNKLQIVKEIRKLLENQGVDPVFYAPGFIAQGGNIDEFVKIAGNKLHTFVGRGIYKSNDIRKSTIEYTKQV